MCVILIVTFYDNSKKLQVIFFVCFVLLMSMVRQGIMYHDSLAMLELTWAKASDEQCNTINDCPKTAYAQQDGNF